MVRSVSVTLAMALTTTTGFCARRPSTMEATRSMALASSTDVPPNFMTIMGGSCGLGSCRRRPSRCARDSSLRLQNGSARNDAIGFEEAKIRFRRQRRAQSSQVAFGLQEFGVEDGDSGGPADRVVGKDGEFPVEDAAGTEGAGGRRHAGTHVDIEARLGAVGGFQVDDGAFGGAG